MPFSELIFAKQFPGEDPRTHLWHGEPFRTLHIQSRRITSFCTILSHMQIFQKKKKKPKNTNIWLKPCLHVTSPDHKEYLCICLHILMAKSWDWNTFFTPQPKLGSRGIVVIRRAGGRAWPQHRYRSHGRSSYPIAVKLGRDEPWGRTSDEFVLGRRGSLIKRLRS